MLILENLNGPHDQKTVLAEFLPQTSTWIVSDLRSKIDLQRRLIGQGGFLHGQAVMRASELWQYALRRLRPDLQIVSREFMTALIAQELTVEPLEWTQSPATPSTVYDYITQLMPILSHPEGDELIAEWFLDNPASQIRWERWWTLAKKQWSGFLQQGFIAAPWVSGVLINETNLPEVWTRPLIIDLGAELSAVEAELMTILSRSIDVTVLRPMPVWKNEYQKTLQPYEILANHIATRTGRTPIPVEMQTSVQFKKFTTMIAEVKDATATVRKWLDSGEAKPRQIAIVAPEIETYWPALSSYLKEEGVPVQKAMVARLHSFSDITQWLASLRLKSGAVSETDLEISIFESSARVEMNYERFRVLFSAVYSRDDLRRSSDLAQRFALEFKSDDAVSRTDFVAWSLKAWVNSGSSEHLETLLQRLFQECPEGTRLQLRRWVLYVEQLASRVEIKINEAQADGIACLNLMSAENSPATNLIFMGLTEKALRPPIESGISYSDVLSLQSRFGFYLPSNDQSKLEFETRWVTENSGRRLILSVAETDFAGDIQAPSWLWLRGARAQQQASGDVNAVQDQRSIPQETRWDEIQRSTFSWLQKEREWSAARAELLWNSLEQDRGDKPIPEFAHKQVLSLSASGLEDYLKCPFIFAAKRLFRLSDLPNLDLDVDAATRGKLMHSLFERLLEDPVLFARKPDELSTLLDEVRITSKMELADDRLWPSMRERYIEMAQRFLLFEKEWRTRFPGTQTVGREVSVVGAINPQTAELRKTKTENDIVFRGFIDRVDTDGEGNFAIIDYKSSINGLSQPGSWIEGQKLQLILYTMAFEKGLTDLPAGQVVSAVYYVGRTMNRDFGFKIEDYPQNLYSFEDRRKNRMSFADREALFAKAQELVLSSIAKMHEGLFPPAPSDPKLCLTCQWSAVCRTPMSQ
jgi:ATP-dependent helicase/nuclease subunit B